MYIVLRIKESARVAAYGPFPTDDAACAFRARAEEAHKEATGTWHGVDYRVTEIRTPDSLTFQRAE